MSIPVDEALLEILNGPDPVSCLEEYTSRVLEANFTPALTLKGKLLIWPILFQRIQEETAGLTWYLRTLRILTRDKADIEKVIDDGRIYILIEMAKFDDENFDLDPVLEALKCLCNLCLNYNDTARILSANNVTEALITRIAIDMGSYGDDIQMYDLKLLFLITALNKEARTKAYVKANGIDFFTNLLQKKQQPAVFYCDVLKLLFNILIELDLTNPNNRREMDQNMRLLAVLRIILKQKDRQLINNVVNLLTVFSPAHLIALIAPASMEEDPDFSAINKIICHLDNYLTELEENPSLNKDIIAPIVLVLYRLAETHSCCRKYMRFKILPKLTDVSTRPEQGDTIRNKLCRLLTCPVESVSNLVADFLFMLCKENVTRLVKHTGFGNAAGFLARHGLMGSTGDVNGDTEDSDTEEYTRDKHLINPIIGCKEELRENPMDKMPEEQKEYLAMELVQKIDKLQRDGIIQPCRIVDGRPEPIQSVLQLSMDQDISDQSD